jgi:hypothetical protein
MSCNCQINVYNNSCEASGMWDETRVARKEHKCCECNATIKPGQKYEIATCIVDRGWSSYKTCIDCISVRDALFCSWVYTELWESVARELNSLPSSECMMQMTKRGRDMVCDLLESSWNDDDEN